MATPRSSVRRSSPTSPGSELATLLERRRRLVERPADVVRAGSPEQTPEHFAEASKAPPGRARKPYWPATSPVRKRLATASRVTIGDPRSSLAARPEQLDVSSLRRQLEAAALSRRQEAMRLEDARRCAQAQHAEALATREELQRGQRRAEAMAAERDAAMRDVEELRRQVDELQAEVAELRGKSEVLASSAQQELESLRAELSAAEQARDNMSERLRAAEAEIDRWRQQVGERVAERDASRTEAEELRGVVRDLRGEVCFTKGEVQRWRLKSLKVGLVREASTTSGEESPASSEGQLRAALTKPGGSSEELRSAIGSAAALVEEARRELAARELRERRAAYERLHAALASDEEDALAAAVAEASRTGVDAVDVERAAMRLEAMRSLSAEERGARLRERAVAEAKREAFVLVRRDRAEELQELLDGLLRDVEWRAWRDYSGRSLLAYARQLHSSRVCARFGALPADTAPSPEAGAAAVQESVQAVPEEAGSASPGSKSPPCKKLRPLTPRAEAPSLAIVAEPPAEAGEATTAPPLAAPEQVPLVTKDLASVKPLCFRAVVQNDAEGLVALLEGLPLDVWSAWRNKAGKDLVALSEERGASAAYGVLARASGLVQERRHAALEEGESVWVLEAGELQPRRATVLEAVGEDAGEVRLEFWDGDEPDVLVQRALVSKAYC